MCKYHDIRMFDGIVGVQGTKQSVRYHEMGGNSMFTSVCKHCHKVFRAPIRTMCCKECRSLDENSFDDIEKYLKMYPNSNALQISEELGINAYVILKFMEEGRLLVSRGTFSRLSDED